MFVDWISVTEHHGEGAREFVGGLSFTYDEHGEPQAETGKARKLKGSFSSSLMVRSHGGRVTVSGNPSRWMRPDNLFGFDLDTCMEVINEVLAGVDLPAFTKGQPKPTNVKSIDGFNGLPGWTGATFTRLDLTENFIAGSDLLARLAIKAYSARAGKYLRKAVYGEETVMFHNTRRTVKVYRKGPDMAVHSKESPWIEWANQQGVVRHEVELKYRYLHDTGLRYWGNCTMGTLHQLFTKESAVLGTPDLQFEPVAMEVLPRPARVIYAAWLKGEDIRALVPRASFYRHRKALLGHGVDIAEVRPFGQATAIVRTVELTRAEAPAGYFARAA